MTLILSIYCVIFTFDVCNHFVSCMLAENPLDRLKKKCAFCNGSYNILHPSDGEFVCGKKRQKKEFFKNRNVYEWRFDHLPLDS